MRGFVGNFSKVTVWVVWVAWVYKILVWSLKFGVGPKLGAVLTWFIMCLKKFNHKLCCLFSLIKKMHRLNHSVKGLA